MMPENAAHQSRVSRSEEGGAIVFPFSLLKLIFLLFWKAVVFLCIVQKITWEMLNLYTNTASFINS